MVNETAKFIEKQAYDWLVKLEVGDMLDGDEERFVDWLSQDEAHGIAFSQVEETWRIMHEASQEAEKYNKSKKGNKVTDYSALFKQKFLPLAASFLILSFTLLFGKSIWIPITADFYTSTGERIEHSLPDGTIVTLNTGSAIKVLMEEHIREIEVLEGEIYVVVAPDQQRDFVVQAGDMRVTALGTEFIVHKRSNQDALVIVTEHSVKVENKQNNSMSLVLDVGESITLDNEQKQFSRKSKVNRQRESAWLKGKYVFTDETLETVINELSRYYKGKIVIMDDSLKTLKLNGVLDLDEPHTSLQNLTYTLPIKVQNITPYLALIEKW